MILGMPTFRNYYTTFDRQSRQISFARHNGDCEPLDPSILHDNLKQPSLKSFGHEPESFWQMRADIEKPRLQRIDLSKVVFSDAYYQIKRKNGNLHMVAESIALREEVLRNTTRGN